MDDEKFQPTMRLRWIESEWSEESPTVVVGSYEGMKTYYRLQQFWITKTDEPGDWKAEFGGEWRDIKIGGHHE